MMSNGENPRTILQEIMPNGVPDLDDFSLWRLLLTIVSEPPPREKLLTVNTISDVIHLIQKCQNIIVLTGAGVCIFLQTLMNTRLNTSHFKLMNRLQIKYFPRIVFALKLVEKHC